MSEEVCIRRKKDGLFYVGRERGFVPSPKFLRSAAKAHAVVRVDLGDDLSDYDFLPRNAPQFANTTNEATK